VQAEVLRLILLIIQEIPMAAMVLCMREAQEAAAIRLKEVGVVESLEV
jgi:hypothetical protein